MQDIYSFVVCRCFLIFSPTYITSIIDLHWFRQILLSKTYKWKSSIESFLYFGEETCVFQEYESKEVEWKLQSKNHQQEIEMLEAQKRTLLEKCELIKVRVYLGHAWMHLSVELLGYYLFWCFRINE